MKTFNKIRKLSVVALMVAAVAAPNAFANGNYSCTGPVTYLGLSASGDIVVALNSGTVHSICNTSAQGSYAMPVMNCKLAYAALLTARVAGKSMTIYYNPNGMSCTTLPSWGTVPSVYFVQGPD